MSGRPLPAADALSAPFWKAAARGVLAIQRCQACRAFWHPPREYCLACESMALEFEQVSGRGVVYSYTRTESGARHPYFQGESPYLVGLVELAEQPGLVLLTNFPGATLERISVGAPVEVSFQPLDGGISIPQFFLSPSAHDEEAGS